MFTIHPSDGIFVKDFVLELKLAFTCWFWYVNFSDGLDNLTTMFFTGPLCNYSAHTNNKLTA